MSLRFIPILCASLWLSGCITPDNSTVEGTGTPDVTQCSILPNVEDGADYTPQDATKLGIDGRTHPDIFYLGWAELDQRTDLRFPGSGYDEKGFEDKLLVSRRQTDGSFRTWQVWPPLDNDCKDTEQVRIQSFDVAPDGKSLFVAMSREETDNPDRKLGIYRLDIGSQTLEKISNDNSVDFMYPTYIGNDPSSNHELLFVAKTVNDDELPINYAAKSTLRDEYDRAPTPLIHKLDTETKTLTRIGFNNSHQTDPVAIKGPDGNNLVVFTQWEHQESTNRFALWKMQVDGSDSFTFYGQESSTDKSGANIFSPREIKTGAYKGYMLMTQATRSNHHFAAEGDIIMTKRGHLDLRSDRVTLQALSNSNSSDQNISRTPDHYNDQSFVYSNRTTVDNAYSLFIKDYPIDIASTDTTSNLEVMSHNDYHFVQPRSFYPPTTNQVAATEGQLGQSRVSFTNNNLNGKTGFLVQNLAQSDNGVQHQLDGVAAADISMQFFIPSHHFSDSNSIGLKNASGSEMSIPVGGFIKPEADGSLGAILKEGLYVWKVNKRFEHTDASGQKNDVWIPVRAERQEINFVANRVNACNQCHQERSQANLDLYADYHSTAATKMQGDLSDVLGTYNDVSTYNAYNSVPDFHGDIVALLNKPGLNSGANNGKTCATCHNAKDKLNLANKTGVSNVNATYRNLVTGAHKLGTSETTIPYLNASINPMGMDDSYHYAPFLWSLLLNDDLSVASDTEHADSASRNLDRFGDYGAKYSADIVSAIADINGQYDHSRHWSSDDIQTFITYTTTQIPVGLSNRIAESFTKSSLETNDAAAQKAYQSMVRNCFSCHNNHNTVGIDGDGFGLPKEKRFKSSVWLKDSETRFVIKSHLADKDDTQYSPYIWQSNLTSSMAKTLQSASYRIDFITPDASELLTFAKGETANDNVSNAHENLSVSDADYKAIEDWVKKQSSTNQEPIINAPSSAITLKEYDDPAYLAESITWSDADVGDISQVFISGENDTMLSLEYESLTSARLKTYAILGDRGEQELSFTVTDGLQSSTSQTIPLTITSDYISPKPVATLPNAYAFYTNRTTGELRKLDTAGGDTAIGLIEGYSSDWTTVYRRADKGWLYFMNQNQQIIYVVDETDASVQFTISLNHEPNKDADSHKQTVYLLWWRSAEGEVGDADYRAGELQALLESKLSKNKNGDFYIGLGDGEKPATGNNVTIVPEYRTKLTDGGNTVSVYVWRRATFMNKLVNQGIDRLNVLNLETGKAKGITSFSFAEKTIDGITYPAKNYFNVRAVVVTEDGAFYGINKDLNADAEVFMFDPIKGIQQVVSTIPAWILNYINNPIDYGTPFLVINKQGE